MTKELIVPNMPRSMPEDGGVPSVPEDCWPIAVKKTIANSKGESFDEQLEGDEREQAHALEVLATIKKLTKRKRDELMLVLTEEMQEAVQSVFRALGRRRKQITVSPKGIEAAGILQEYLDEYMEESGYSQGGGRGGNKRTSKKKKAEPLIAFPELHRTQEKITGGREKFLVHFLPSPSDISFGKPAAEALIAHMKEHGYTWLFLVTVSGVTPYATRATG